MKSFLVFWVLSCAVGLIAGDTVDPSLKMALEKHLSALRSKDLKSFSETLSPDKLTLVLPNGKLIKTPREFVEMHREWFGEAGWSMTHKVHSISQNGNMGFALVKSEYREEERDGKPYLNTMYVSRIFEKVNGKWLLVYDQATAIKD